MVTSPRQEGHSRSGRERGSLTLVHPGSIPTTRQLYVLIDDPILDLLTLKLLSLPTSSWATYSHPT